MLFSSVGLFVVHRLDSVASRRMSQTEEAAEEKLTCGDGGGRSHEEGQSDFDDLLHSTTLDTLTDL